MGNNTRLQLTAIVASGVLAACASTAPSTPAAAQAAGKSTAHEAEVNLASASGSLVSGHLAIRPMGDGVHITGEVGGLKPGDTRGFHIHEKGDCSSGDGMGTGGHFNPDAQPHGPQHGAPVAPALKVECSRIRTSTRARCVACTRADSAS